MRSAVVLGGRFRVFDDGAVNRIRDGHEEPAVMTPTGREGKYLIITYMAGKNQKRVYVHRLIAMTFVPNPDRLPEVNHIDGDTRNNAVDNLEWVTRKENANHAVKIGLTNTMAHAEPCTICGKWTISKSHICPSCSRKISLDAKRLDRSAKLSDRLSAVSLEKLGKRQAEYVAYAMMGLSPSEIAEKCGVSKQRVSAALRSAEQRKPLTAAERNKVVSLLRRSERNKRRMEEAVKAYDTAKAKMESAENELYELGRSYGYAVDELLADGKDVKQ